jgi:hypothetical protein
LLNSWLRPNVIRPIASAIGRMSIAGARGCWRITAAASRR